MPATILARGTDLTWESQGAGNARVNLGGRGARALCLRVDGGRVRVAMEVATGRPVDVTVQPGLAARLIDESAARNDADQGTVRVLFVRCLVELVASAGLPQADSIEGASLEAAVLAASYPLAAAAIAGGVTPIRDVPRWAVSALAEPNARAALETIVGRAGTNRRGARALVASLTPPPSAGTEATLALYPLALVAMGAPALNADRVANALEMIDPFRPLVAWPSTDEVATARRVLRRFSPVRAARLLSDAALLPDGPARMLFTLRALHEVGPELPDRLPHGLAELEELWHALVPMDPRGNMAGIAPAPVRALPMPAAGPVRARPREFVPAVRAAGPVAAIEPANDHAGALALVQLAFDGQAVLVAAAGGGIGAPARGVRALAGRRERAALAPAGARAARGEVLPAPPIRLGHFQYEPDVMAIDGQTTHDGRLTIVLPRTAAELSQWSLILRNCADEYETVVAQRRTTLIGVRDDGRLVYLLEWRRPGKVIQFVTHSNRPVPRTDAAAVLNALIDSRLIGIDAAQDCLNWNEARLQDIR